MNWCPFEFIGRTFGEEREAPKFPDPADFESGLIVDSGICYMKFFRKLFIPCYLRTENFGRSGVCSPVGVNDAAQRCKEKKRKRRRRRKLCKPVKLIPKKECSTPKIAAPIEQTPPPAQTLPAEKAPPAEPSVEVSHPEPEQTKRSNEPMPQKILCPSCNAPTTIIICDACNRCHKIECNTNN